MELTIGTLQKNLFSEPDYNYRENNTDSRYTGNLSMYYIIKSVASPQNKRINLDSKCNRFNNLINR